MKQSLAELATTTTTRVDDDDTASISSTFTADHGMTIKYAGAAEDDNNNDNDTNNNEEADESDNFSVKTHLDSVTSLPKKRRQRRSRSKVSPPEHSSTTKAFGSELYQQQQQQHQRSSTVQFDTSSIIYHESCECLREEDEEEDYEQDEYQTEQGQQHEYENDIYNVNVRWYGPQDYKQFKLNVISIVKAVFKAQRHRARNPNQDNFSYSDTLESVYHACFQMELEVPKCNILSKPEQREFQRLYRATVDVECCLGLERLLVQRIGKDRSELRTSLFGIIQDLQTSEGWPTRELLEDNIFQISQEVSRPARLFARHLALAQAASVAKEAKHASSSSRTSTSTKEQHHQRHSRQPEEHTIVSLSSSSACSSSAERRNSH